MYVIRWRETGIEIDRFDKIQDAKKEVQLFEDIDKAEGTWTKDFYEIVKKRKNQK